jgi:predicted acetyltransferase
VTDGHIGVFNIATPPAHRAQGYGRAVTARVLADGVRGGAHTAYLQASPMGFGVYQRMGFRTAETWACHYPG